MQAAQQVRDDGRPPRLHELAQLVAAQGQRLTHARALVILMARGEETCLTALAGAGVPHGWPSGRESWSQPRAPFRVSSPSPELDRWVRCVGVRATQMLGVPIGTGDGRAGVMVACDRATGDEPFTAEDEWLLQSFAAFAGLAIGSCEANERAIALSLRTVASARADERVKWARELHDETLQNLAVVQALLSSALTEDARVDLETGIRRAADHVTDEIGSLRHMITELRPTSVVQVGLLQAVAELAQEAEQLHGMEIKVLADDARALGGGARLLPELELTAYRIVQEALRNVVRHASADAVYIWIAEVEDALVVAVRDDGHGFLAGSRAAGVGLLGMEERAASVGGSWSLSTDRIGTEIRAVIPLEFADES